MILNPTVKNGIQSTQKQHSSIDYTHVRQSSTNSKFNKSFKCDVVSSNCKGFFADDSQLWQGCNTACANHSFLLSVSSRKHTTGDKASDDENLSISLSLHLDAAEGNSQWLCLAC